MSATAIIVTRGDVCLEQILDSIPSEWETIVWDNGLGHAFRYSPPWQEQEVLPGRDLSVFGRYAAIEYATHELIYVQDDDVVVSNPRAIVDQWAETRMTDFHETVICNMPQEFRHSFYDDHALVGFGAAFHRDQPQRAFDLFQEHNYGITFALTSPTEPSWFHRTCDIVFTSLMPRVLVDVPKENLPWADDPGRMWKQPEHQAERARMLDLVKEV